MRSLWACAIISPLLLLVAASGVPAAGAASLTADEQAMLTELLGEGVVGEPVAGAALTPKFAPLREGTWTFQIASGDKRGQSEQHVVSRLENDPSGADWRYAVGTTGVVLIEQAADGSLTFVSTEDTAQAVVTRYDPAEPGVLVGLVPGDSRSMSVAVAVAKLSNPGVVSYKGTLDVTYSYLGAYKVTTPAGTYDAALVKWTYQGKVGPAKVDDTQYRFLAENVGMVATIDQLEVSAMLVYHKQTKFGKVLAAAPR
jgi:hypothetical protein